MDERLLRLYNRELQHLRESAAEFARDFPKIAGRLGLEGFECADPYVERLLEGAAYMAARVQLKIESEFPRFTQHLLEVVYPHYLCPMPSMAIVQFQADLTEGSLAEGPEIPRGSPLRSILPKGEQTRCIYSTVHPVRLWPIEIIEAAYHTRDLGSLGLENTRHARAALRLRLRATAGQKFNQLPVDRLTLHLRGQGATAMRLYEALFTHVCGVFMHAPARPPKWVAPVPPPCLRQVGFDDDQAMLPYGPRSFHGYRLLQEYFAFSDRFMFVDLTGLNGAFRRTEGDVIDFTILLRSADIELENAVSAANFLLNCAPAVNLFEKRLDRIHITDRTSEFHVVPDRTAPLDYEVYRIHDVVGYGASGVTDEQRFEPFYTARDSAATADARYYAVTRVPRVLSEREKLGRRRTSRYAGSETYLSLVDVNAAPWRGDLKQLAVTALCTNRDLPIHMPIGQGPTDFTLETGAPVAAIRCVGTPTPPAPSLAEGDFAWRLVNHLRPNYLTLLDTQKGDAAAALRDLLGLYADATRPEIRKQIEGVKQVQSRPVIRRIHGAGPVSFARGLEVAVTLDEAAFEGTGIFLLGAVLERFFAKYATLNVFTTTTIRSAQRGEVKQWPARTGLLNIL
ncbi:MAG: type VI secretion system baseplate subunit TssF [Phycisphaeraceae bacterium]|nr:MAG: type VI secretion system baseplate subunit TssF [Phycisphaeraceae bacterium]